MTILTKAFKLKIYINERDRSDARYSSILTIITVLLTASLIFVWSHVRLTELKYDIAKEISIKENLTEQNKKLKLEIASLKAPNHLERIGRDKFEMTYPEREQVIFLK
jgi:cell division protein FtsL